MEGSIRRVPAMEEAAGQEVLQRPRGLHARRRVHPRRVRGARVLGRRGVLRARSRGRGRHRQGHGRVDRRGAARVGPLAHGHPPLRPPVPLAELHARSATIEVYSTYYDIKYPGEERLAGRPLRVSPAYARHTRDGASFGEKSGWERVNWFDVERPAGDDDLRPRGWAGKHWSPAIGAECIAAARAGRALRPVVVREARRPRARRGRVPRPDVRERGRPAGRLGHLHAAAATSAAASSADLTVTRLARGPLPARHRHRVRLAQPRLAAPAPARPTASRVRRRHHLGAGAATASGGRARATSCSR